MKLTPTRRKIFETLTQAIGVMGDEKEVAKILRSYYERYCDEIIYDNLGSIYAVKKSKIKDAPKVMVAAHMDEVGFKVGQIMKDGTLKFSEASSGIWEQTVMSQRVTVLTKDGKKIKGVVDAIPPHTLTPELRATPMKTKDMIVDIGCKSKKEVEDLGVNIFDSIVIDGPFVELNDGSRLLSKAFDNRYGCILGVEVLKALKNVELPCDLYVGADVQEEAGLRGAVTATNMIKPDFAIVLDCSPATDMGDNKEGFGYLGGGVLNRFVDGAMIAFPELLKWQRKMCNKNKVKYQYFLSLGGTDAGAIHRSLDGVLTLTHCICARNIHTSGSIIDLNDYEGAKKVLISMLKNLDSKLITKFKNERR